MELVALLLLVMTPPYLCPVVSHWMNPRLSFAHGDDPVWQYNTDLIVAYSHFLSLHIITSRPGVLPHVLSYHSER
jgi:hypothetical protein